MRVRVRWFGVVAAAMLLTATAPAGAAVAPPSVTTAAGATSPRIASGWVAWWRLADGMTSVEAHPELFRDVAFFWFTATTDSTVVEQPGAPAAVPALSGAVTTLAGLGIPSYVTVTDTGFDAGRMARLLGDRDRRRALAVNLVAAASGVGASGVDIDFEAMNAGRSGANRTAVKRLFPSFLGALRNRLHRHGMRLSVALPARTGPRDPSWEVFDYPRIAANVDRARVMTYDHRTGADDPGPVAPLPWVTDVARYVGAVFGRKASLGLPAYGYNWFVRRLSGACPTEATTPTTGTTRAFVDLAATYGATPAFDRAAAGYRYAYRRSFTSAGRSCRVERVVWYEDSRSVAVKLPLLDRYRLGTVALWTLGGERRGTWRVLTRYAASR